MIKLILSAIRKIEDLGTFIAAIVVFLVMALGIVEIVGRSFFASPIHGQTDMVIVMMPLIVFLGISQCLRKDSHIQMSLLIDMLSERAKAMFQSIGCLVSAVASFCLAFGAYQNFERALAYNDNTADLKITTWPFKLIVAGSLCLLGVRFAIFAYGHFRQFRAIPTKADGDLLPEINDHLDIEVSSDA